MRTLINSAKKSETFYKVIANIIFAIERARPDNGTSISYLTIIVRDPDQSNWLKMVHILKYVRGTKYLSFVLIACKSGMIKWYID